MSVNGAHVTCDSMQNIKTVLAKNLDKQRANDFENNMLKGVPYKVDFEKGVTAVFKVANKHLSPFDMVDHINAVAKKRHQENKA